MQREWQKCIEMVYFTIGRNKETSRTVAPYSIWFFSGTLYLIGFCHLRQDVRLFALDRIKSVNKTEEPFEIPEEFDVEDFMKASFGVFQGDITRVKIWFAPEIADHIKEKTWHESQVIQEEGDGAIIFEAEVAGTDEIKFWIMSWGSKARVIEPESLKNDIRADVRLMLKAYG